MGHHMSNPAVKLRARAKTIVHEIELARTAAKLTLRLSHRAVLLGWIVVLLLHFFNAFYSLAMAYLYDYLSKPDMTYYVELLQMMPQKNYRVVIALYSVISAINFFNAFEMILCSIYYRHLVFGLAEMSGVGDSLVHPEGIPIIGRCKILTRIFLTIGCSTSLVGGIAEAISVRGGWFDDMLLIREISELASQTVQAHSSSLQINSVWVNQFFAALIFLNAIVNMLVHMMLKKEVGWRRFICTGIDLILDFVWGFILPGKIIYQYFTMFVRHNYSLPAEFAYSDTDIIKAMLECDQFFMVSWLDAVTTTLPYLNMLSSLRSIKSLLQHDIDTLLLAKTARISSVVPQKARPMHISSHGSNTAIPGPRLPPSTKRSWRWYFTRMTYVLMPLWGTAVLLISILASRAWLPTEEACILGCRLQMHPWFATKCACSVLEINCHEYGIEGNAFEMDLIMNSLDERTLNSLIITHCPNLAMTPKLRAFYNLMQIEFYNCTLVDWPEEASLSLPYFPRLGAVFIVRSTLQGGIPPGLTTDLAPNLIDIEFIATDFGHELPSDLADKWTSVPMLYLEHCNLQEFPAVLSELALTDISLVGNNISMLPDDLPDDLPWMYAYFDSNPLERLPDNLSLSSDFTQLSVQSTRIGSLPSWLRESAEAGAIDLFAFNTSFCRNASRDVEGEWTLAHCAGDTVRYASEGVFPLAMKDKLRAFR